MTDQERPNIDISFYTRLRHRGPARKIIQRFARAQRQLLQRMEKDIRRGRRGRFGTEKYEGMRPAMASGIARLTNHVDAWESILLEAPGPSGDIARSVFANVVADSNLVEVAEAHTKAPKAAEGKFDVSVGSVLTGVSGDIADKLWQFIDLLKEEWAVAGFILNLIGVILRDLGIYTKSNEAASGNEIAQQVEDKLEYVADGVDGLTQGQKAIGATVGRIEAIETLINTEVNRIEIKAETLADLLGRTLVGEPWQVNPDKTVSGKNKVPPISVKDEMHGIEDMLKLIIKIIRLWGPIIEYPPPPPTDDPPSFDSPRVRSSSVLQDSRLKKIFIYADNRFKPASTQQRRVIRVRTGAFDLTGWLDLTGLKPGDEVTMEVWVLVAGRRRRFATTRFNQPGLKPFADFALGQNYLSGHLIDLVIRQSRSASAFKHRLEIGYQFVVESQ